jgi:hypothetical protein
LLQDDWSAIARDKGKNDDFRGMARYGWVPDVEGVYALEEQVHLSSIGLPTTPHNVLYPKRTIGHGIVILPPATIVISPCIAWPKIITTV